jgi:hypothetical protein
MCLRPVSGVGQRLSLVVGQVRDDDLELHGCSNAFMIVPRSAAPMCRFPDSSR